MGKVTEVVFAEDFEGLGLEEFYIGNCWIASGVRLD
jgi:hypothetical protein